MKTLRLMLVLLALCTVTFAQSDAQRSFDKLKTLAGLWEGTFEGSPVHLSVRVASSGNAILHEMNAEGPEDTITVFYVDGDRLLLTHYCHAGNRPRMVGTISPDGKTINFNFLDVSGNTQQGEMRSAAFNLVDTDHHSETWNFAMADGKQMEGSLDLKRTK